MEININWIAVIVAIVASMVLAKVWFHQKVFGGAWRKLTGISPADSKKVGKKPITITLFANILTVVVLAVMIGNSSLGTALWIGFVAWAAFSATTLVTHNAFEQKPAKLTAINNGYQLVLFLIVTFILGIF
jgi:methionine-rich copper-binding protein CopC